MLVDIDPKTLDLMAYIGAMRPERFAQSSEPASTAVLILPGLQDWRLTNCPWARYAKTVWVAGTADDPGYSALQVRQFLNLQRTTAFTHQGFARHTPDQMNWAVQQLTRSPFINHLIISTAAYHLPRCMLTFTKCWLQHRLRRQIMLSTLPTVSHRAGELFDGNAAHYGKSGSVLEEATRIEEYRKNGHVATAEEFWQVVSLH